MPPNNTHRTVVSLKFPHAVLALIALARAIVQALTGNKSFPSPDPSLPVLTSAIADLEAAQGLVHTRALGSVPARNQKRDALLGLLRSLKGFVQKVADTDPVNAATLIESAAMGTRKVAHRQSRAFAAKVGPVSGSAALVAPTAGAHVAYEWQYSGDGGKTWQGARGTSRARTTITGLVPGSTYLFRCRPIDRTGDTDWCQPLSLIVQ